MPAGRPTKYSKAMQKKADWYVDGGYLECDDAVPSKAGLSCELGVTRKTMESWGQENGQFLSTLHRLMQKQERTTLSGGLRSDFNPTIAKLLLANHGYSDRQEVDHRSQDGSMSPQRIEIVSGSQETDGTD